MITKPEAAGILQDQLDVVLKKNNNEGDFIIVTVDTPTRRSRLVDTLELAIQTLNT